MITFKFLNAAPEGVLMDKFVRIALVSVRDIFFEDRISISVQRFLVSEDPLKFISLA